MIYERLSVLEKCLTSIAQNKYSRMVNILVKEAASKKNALKKLGFSEEVSQKIDDTCRGFSLWMAYRLIDHVTKENPEAINDKQKAIEHINNNFSKYGGSISFIMDWVKVGLEGEYQQYKETSFLDLLKLSKEWHDSLQAGDGDLNYIENNKIILDFRDSNGIGFYWANLNCNDSEEESDRMGHCGITSHRNTLYSLRKVTEIRKGYTLNESVLTAAITPDGKIAQLKGRKNSKPKEEYKKYIIPLLNLNLEDEEGNKNAVITGFKSEYESDEDFSIADLSLEELLDIKEKNPSFFSSLSSKLMLAVRTRKRSIDESIIEFNPDNELLDLMFNPSSRSSFPASEIKDFIVDPTEIGYRMFDYTGKDDVKYALTDINDENKNKIIEILNANPYFEIEIDKNNFNEKIIENFNDFRETEPYEHIRDAIVSAKIDASVNEAIRQIVSGLSNFGKAKVYDGEILLKINIIDFLREIPDEDEEKVYAYIDQLEDTGSTDKGELANEFLKFLLNKRIIEQEYFDVDLDRGYNANNFNVDLKQLI